MTSRPGQEEKTAQESRRVREVEGYRTDFYIFWSSRKEIKKKESVPPIIYFLFSPVEFGIFALCLCPSGSLVLVCVFLCVCVSRLGETPAKREKRLWEYICGVHGSCKQTQSVNMSLPLPSPKMPGFFLEGIHFQACDKKKISTKNCKKLKINKTKNPRIIINVSTDK